jgi:hypothetical protein
VQEQEPAAKYIGECSDGSLVQFYDDVKKGTDLYTTPPAAQPAPVPAAQREPDDSFDIDDVAYALEAILQRAGEGATVGHVIALLENLAKPEQEPVAWAKEYAAINEFYGKQTADRSGLSLMRHIDDGLHILTLNGASDTAKAAFCLHPLVQNSEVVDVSWSPAYSLACEYKGKANAYLCRPDTDWVSSVGDVQSIVGEMTDDCRAMLIADKRQNYGDFIAAHYGKHLRSKELDRYFRLWIAYLEGYATPPAAQRQWVKLTPQAVHLALKIIKEKNT